MQQPTVLVENLVKTYGPVRAVDGASWSASAGEVTAVLGPNGSGKTTTIECLEGLNVPTSGAVRVLGHDPASADADHRARVGVMLQDGGLPSMVSAGRLLNHLATLYADPIPPAVLGSRLGIDAFARTIVRRLSGGQRQKLALAAALIGRPRVVFLDEPSAGLDPHARLDVWEIIEGLRADGVTVVVTTHSFDEAERIADSVVVMHAGRVVADGTVKDVAGSGGLESAYFSLIGRSLPPRRRAQRADSEESGPSVHASHDDQTSNEQERE